MAGDERTAGPGLSGALRRPHGLDWFQVVSLLERSAPGAAPLGHGSGRGEAVRLAARVGLGFEPGDIAELVALAPGDADAPGDAARWLLRTPLMALAGANGPLPLADTERLLASERARDTAPRDFLDLFHHRWLSLLYRARAQHRPALQWRGPADSPLSRVLDALGALGIAGGRPGPAGERPRLRHAGLHGAAPRSAAGLEALLADRLAVPVAVRSFVGGWLDLDPDATPPLGRGCALGRTAVLGRRAWDASAGVSIRIGPLAAGRWDAFLPGGADLARLRWLAVGHAQRDLQLHVELQPASGPDAPRTALGRARLGRSAWLGGAADAATRADTPPHRPASPVHLRLPSTGAAET